MTVARPAPLIPGAVGLLGGTFDPIHLGHLAVAEEAREALGLEKVVFVPAAAPPHKPGLPISPAGDRAAMVELAIRGNPAFELSRIELARAGPSYAVDTLAELAGTRAADGRPIAWTFVLSVDALLGLPAWREPLRLLDLCRMAVAPREGWDRPEAAWLEEQFPGRSDRFTFLDGPRLAISASAVRERVALGRSIRYLVPDDVRAYIADHSLYRTPARRNQ